MTRPGSLAVFVLCAGIVSLASPVAARQTKAKQDKVVSLTKDLRAALLKRGEFQNLPPQVPAVEALQAFSKSFNVKFIINEEAFRAEGITNFRDQKLDGGLRGGNDARPDVILNDFFRQVHAQPEIRDGAIWIVPRPTGPRAQYTTIRQGPDTKHVAAVKAVRSVLARRIDAEARPDIPLAEFLQVVEKKYEIPFVVRWDTFRAAGVKEPLQGMVAVKGAKEVSVESMLRTALSSGDADIVPDAYGRVEVVYKTGKR
jgi:hypothetical protein